MTEHFEPTDTAKLQLRSLEIFMNALGYKKADSYFDDCINFYSILYENRHRATIAFNTAVKLHNGQLLDWHGKRFRDPFAMDIYKMRVAQASKIVHRVKLMYQKKTKRVLCQDNRVEFIYVEYASLFLDTDHE